MGCPLPGDRYFNQINNPYDKTGYERVCKEFNISSTTDFRYRGGENHGLGTIYKTMLNGKTYQMSDIYDKQMNGVYTTIWPDGYFYFRDQGESWGDKGFDYIQPKEAQPYIYFMLNDSKGLSKAGLSRLNQSIEAYVYCILGSQVNTRSSIIGESGSAQETQTVFLQLFESVVVERDISKSIQRYQLAIQEAKVKLDFAVSPGCWLLPSRLVINTQSTVGYNNKLQKATTNMNFGFNDSLNTEMKSVGIKHNMDHSKVVLPHTKPDNNEKVKPKPPETKPDVETQPVTTNHHENNLAVVTVVAAGLAWYLFR